MSALVNYYNDYDMLLNQYSSGQFEIYEKVYIFDGPYSFTKKLLPFDKGYIKLSETELGRQLLGNPKFIYSYRDYQDEAEKRISAYESIPEELIILHDTDEFYDFHPELLADFVNSAAGVGYFSCQNLCLDGFHFTKNPKSISDEDFPKKAFAFRKSKVNAIDHLNYLWLIGVRQFELNPALIFAEPLALGYHFTQMRTERGQKQKYLFYTALHQEGKRNESIEGQISNLNELVNSNVISSDTASKIYFQGLQPFTLAPPLNAGFRLAHRKYFGERLENICQKISEERCALGAGDYVLFKGCPLYLYLYSNVNGFRIIFDKALKLHISSYSYSIDENTNETLYDVQVNSGEFESVFEPDPLRHGVLIKIQYWDGGGKDIGNINIKFI